MEYHVAKTGNDGAMGTKWIRAASGLLRFFLYLVYDGGIIDMKCVTTDYIIDDRQNYGEFLR